MQPPATTAPVHGPRWGARARTWAQSAAWHTRPAWQLVADETRIGAGMRVLDIGCGSGEFCAPPPGPPPLGEPAALEDVARAAGLQPVRSGDVDVPMEAPDAATLADALMTAGGILPAIEHSGEDAVRAAIVAAAAPFRQEDGSCRLENRLRWLVSRA